MSKVPDMSPLYAVVPSLMSAFGQKRTHIRLRGHAFHGSLEHGLAGRMEDTCADGYPIGPGIARDMTTIAPTKWCREFVSNSS